MAQSKKNSRNERMIYTVITVLTISAGIITGVWLGQQEPSEPVEDVSAEAKEIPIYFVETDEKKLAISFDAAWGCEHTQQILDVLAAHDIKATFFLTNIWLEEYPDM
ncbi:MAG: polysaccharide deacetylase family protein, partial [Peptococcaceae bacterium]|nr:polysaccharide deacetylase family protein [Peptococcaceae bacterium]